MKINLDFILKDFAGEPLKDEAGSEINVGKVVSRIIMQSPQMGSDIVKYVDWARDLYKDGKLDLDRSDQMKFRSFIEGLQSLSLYVKIAVIESMEPKGKETL